ncbi:MAG: hypothetical protein ACRDZO_14220 [Egibacteraceae bacterium]
MTPSDEEWEPLALDLNDGLLRSLRGLAEAFDTTPDEVVTCLLEERIAELDQTVEFENWWATLCDMGQEDAPPLLPAGALRALQIHARAAGLHPIELVVNLLQDALATSDNDDTDVAEALARELVYLRKGDGLTRAKLERCLTLLNLPCVSRRLRKASIGLPSRAERAITAMRILQDLLPATTNSRAMALRTALAIGIDDPGTLTGRRRRFAAARRVSIDTVRSWEQATIRDLALRLIELGMHTDDVELSGPRPWPEPLAVPPSRGFEAYEMRSLDIDRLYRFRKGRILESCLEIHTVEALADGVTGFVYSSRYSGGNPWVWAEAIDGCQVTLSPDRTDDHIIVRVMFDRPLLRREVYRVVYRLNVSPEAGECVPVACKTTRHPTRSMKLRIQFAPGEVPEVVRTFSTQVGYDPQMNQPLGEYVPIQGYVQASFLDPPLGLKYGFEWAWPDGQAH